MSGFEPTKQHMREALLVCFSLKKSAAESHPLLQKADGEQALSKTTGRDWFRRFKSSILTLKTKNVQDSRKNLKTKTW